MSRKPCRHPKAWPTVYSTSRAGFMWCPDCGAVRQVRQTRDGSFAYSVDRWLYPDGWEKAHKRLTQTKPVTGPFV